MMLSGLKKTDSGGIPENLFLRVPKVQEDVVFESLRRKDGTQTLFCVHFILWNYLKVSNSIFLYRGEFYARNIAMDRKCA